MKVDAEYQALLKIGIHCRRSLSQLTALNEAEHQ